MISKIGLLVINIFTFFLEYIYIKLFFLFYFDIILVSEDIFIAHFVVQIFEIMNLKNAKQYIYNHSGLSFKEAFFWLLFLVKLFFFKLLMHH
jgi:hypothetical protein